VVSGRKQSLAAKGRDTLCERCRLALGKNSPRLLCWSCDRAARTEAAARAAREREVGLPTAAEVRSVDAARFPPASWSCRFCHSLQYLAYRKHAHECTGVVLFRAQRAFPRGK
jgi:hypothetical protein